MTLTIKCFIDKRWDAYRSQNWSLYNSLKLKVNKSIANAKAALFNRKKEIVKGLWSYVNLERGFVYRDLSALLTDD